MKVAMLLQRTSRYDNRVMREARALAAAGHEVTIVELAPGPATPVVIGERLGRLSALPPPALKRWIPFKLHRLVSGFSIARAAARLRPDVVHAHDVAMLPSGWLAARLARARLVYDTHEFALGVAYRTRAYARLVRIVERLFVPRADVVITVSPGIAARLHSIYGRPAVVVRNVADDTGATPGPSLREGLGIDAKTPLVLHQGAPAAQRGCFTLIAAMDQLADAQLVFLGEGEPAFMAQLRGAAAGNARLHFVPARPPEQLLAATAEADVGVSLLEDVCENHRLALPNKVFEYVTAGIPVVASDLPELHALVERYDIGELVDPASPSAVAAGIRAALGRPRSAELQAAARELSWSLEQERLLEAYAALDRVPHTPGPPGPA